MLRSLRNLVERQILKAGAEGQLSGRDGEGQPLPDRPGEAFTDPAIAAGHRIMAEAGVTPPEFELKKQFYAARLAYQKLSDPQEKRHAMARIAVLELRYHLARDTRRAFMR